MEGMPSYDRRDADKAYEQVAGDVRKVLRDVDEKIRAHGHKQREDSKNWGYVGDLTEVLKRLAEIREFLTGEEPESHGKRNTPSR
jgi:hypothetical protein